MKLSDRDDLALLIEALQDDHGYCNPLILAVCIITKYGDPEVDESDFYYLQDTRGFVGNDMLWWGKEKSGYVTDLTKAHIFTKAEAIEYHNGRHSDVPWPKAYIDSKARPAVDMQYVDRAIALRGTGVKIKVYKRPRHTERCMDCGQFITREAIYGPCPNCGSDNSP